MANTKKYISLDKLGMYDEKIKKFLADADAAALKSAKDYADETLTLANNNAASLANTAEANAKAYADGKDAAIQAAHKAGTDAAAAAAVADGKAVAAQGEVDALETYVGTIPTTATATDIVGYINEKTSGIATEGAMTELGNRVGVVEGKVATIEGDYLKAADKTALEGKITEANTAVATEQSRAEGEEAKLAGRIKAIEDDYLVAADKTELANAIAAEAERASGVEGGLETRLKAVEDDHLVAADKEALQNQINTIMNNPDAEGAINSINEFTAYVTEHGTIAEGFRTDIDKNKEDIAANAKAITDHETLAAQTYATKDEMADAVEALQEEIDADVKVVADDLAELDGVVAGLGNTKADKTYVDEQVQALQGVDTGLDNRLKLVEAAVGESGSVADDIATAKQEAIDAAAADATSKANAAEAAAKGHADGLNTAMNTRVEALEAASSTHALASDLTTLAGRVTTAEGEIDTLQGEMDAVEALAAAADAAAKANAQALALKASQADLEAVGARVTTLETWHNNFTEVSEEEINGLFA